VDRRRGYTDAVPGEILIRQLEYLVALAREQHFGKAAAASYVSQPALSAAIRKLEVELGVTIVQRGHRFVGFTPEGGRVVGWAHRILAERDALRDDLNRMRGGLTATLRIGAIPTAVPATPMLTAPFCDRHPQARVTIAVLPSREITRIQEGQDMTDKAAENVIQEWAAGWSTLGAPEQFVSLFAEDCVYEDVAAGVALKGKEEVRGFHEESHVAFPDFTVELTSRAVSGNSAHAQWTMTGTHLGLLFGVPPTGKKISVRGVSVFELRDDKVQTCSDYYDKSTLLGQLGM
jgi:steroid delta-isomerase-like uncharacterized protein